MENKRTRVTKACDFCRRRKVRCSFQPGKICYNCEAYKIPCEFTSRQKKRGPQKGYADDLEQRIEEIQSKLKDTADAKQQKLDETPDFIKTTAKKTRKCRTKKPVFKQYEIAEPQQWPTRGFVHDHVQYLGDLSSFRLFSNKLNWPKFKHWNGHNLKKFGDDVVLVTDEIKNPSKIPVYEDLEMDDFKNSNEDIHQYIYSMTGLDRFTVTRLLKIYFLNVHPILPLIDKSEFLKQYRNKADTYPPGELLNAMLGAAARFVECESLEPRKSTTPLDAIWEVPMGWSDRFFDQAETIISKWSTTPTLSKVQAIILVLNYQANRSSKSSASWQIGGLAIRLAHLLGLHRSCDEWDIPQNEKETRKRTWWALYITDRFQTALLGRPVSIKDEDNTVSYPDPSADSSEIMDELEDSEEIAPRFQSLVQPPCCHGRPKIYELFIQFIKLSEILGRILQGLHSPRGKSFSVLHGSDGLVARLDHELTEWRFGFPTALKEAQIPDFNEISGYFAPTIASTLLFYFSTLILLHQPFIRRTVSKTSYSSSRICYSAATRGLGIAYEMSVRDFLMCPYTFTLYPLIQFTLINVYNAKCTNDEVSKPARNDLLKGIRLTQRLKAMSSTAARVHLAIRKFSSIVGVRDVGQNIDDEQQQEKNTEPIQFENSNNNKTATYNQFVEAIMVRTAEAPLISQLETEQDHPTTTQPAITQEAYSLTQFGFDTSSDTSALDFMLSTMSALPHQPNMNHNTDLNPLVQQQPSGDLFRSDPNNVFWDTPFSLDWEALNHWASSLEELGWSPFE
ncbi:hypothetical protein K501DRAFT_334749 [Backusella circina FSU 941]|nr:hypothetical protein K501DRAFT_334749 [Backusella circina FSU 941]